MKSVVVRRFALYMLKYLFKVKLIKIELKNLTLINSLQYMNFNGINGSMTSENVYAEGCVKSIKIYLSNHSVMLGASAILVAILMVLKFF